MQIADNIVPMEYGAAVAAFGRRDLDDAEFWQLLKAFGYDYREIEWHFDHPGERMPQGYVN